ncbi:hypothetical protein D0Y65_006086 [Glycine soja]|uniref:RING-type domain-containing protein n=1 Tax=Glycine soja TaxID=3848 RepID=A0A445L843_GLYSO|nr:hypothetical protein D0Y65_006086 [Glycine soja]
MDDCCAVCAEPLEWVAYGPCLHREVCSTCVPRLRFICDDRLCCICKTECNLVFATKLNFFEMLPSLASHLAMIPVVVQTILPMPNKDAKVNDVVPFNCSKEKIAIINCSSPTYIWLSVTLLGSFWERHWRMSSISKVHFAIIFFCSLSPEMKLELFKVICSDSDSWPQVVALDVDLPVKQAFHILHEQCFSMTDIIDEHFRFANLDELTYSLRFVDLDKLISRCGSSSCLHSDLEGVEVVAHLNLNLKWCSFQ